MKNMILKITVIILLVLSNIVFSFAQTIPYVYDVENTGASCTKPAVANKTNTKLPDPFEWSNGTGRIASFSDWSCRRNEIKTEIEYYEIGTKPEKPQNITATYSGGTLTVNVTVNGQTLTLTSKLTIPSGAGPFPIVIGMNSPTGGLPTSSFNGCIQMPFNHDQVVKYDMNGGQNQTDPYYKLYPELWGKIGNYSAWSWGISRLIDGLELVKNQINADISHIAVTGCSYAGKMALFAGAFDERIALTIAQESGGGGVNSWRISQEFTTRTGTNVEKIDNTSTSWFKSNLKNNNPNNLPYDHHELIGMIAPRAFVALGNPNFDWMCDESGYKTLMNALEIWKALGVPERFAYSFVPGSNHCSPSTSHTTLVGKYVDRYLFNKTTVSTTNISSADKFANTEYNSWRTWSTPTILPPTTQNPNVPNIVINSPASTSLLEAGSTITIQTTVTDANNDVIKVEFFNGTTKLGEDLQAPYALEWNNVNADAYTIRAIVTDAELNSTTATVSFNVVQAFLIYKTPTTITIDGVKDPVWNNSVIISVLANTVLNGTVSNAADLSGTIKALWDNTYVYLWAEVTDDVLNNDSQNTYDDDNIEIYFDGNAEKATAYDANDVQYSFAWNDGTSVSSLPADRSVTGINYSIVAKTGGYIVEARIPWTTLNSIPAIDKYIGFDFMINDDDAGGTRDGKLSWNSTTDDAWQNPLLFGVAKLKNEIVCNTPNPPTVNELIYYNINDVAIELSAVGENLLWYTSEMSAQALLSAPIPVTTTVGPQLFYVSQTIQGCESDRALITVEVKEVKAEKIQLKTGWNLVGYPFESSSELDFALSNIWDKVEIVKNAESFYQKNNNPQLNSLNEFEWGKGYYIYVSQPCVLEWNN